jgi:hypothetical protein
MIERDRKLMTRLRRVNLQLGQVAVDLMSQQDGGELPAVPLRVLGQNLAALGEELIARAAELDTRQLEAP